MHNFKIYFLCLKKHLQIYRITYIAVNFVLCSDNVFKKRLPETARIFNSFLVREVR
jgi:hypothetical protein